MLGSLNPFDSLGPRHAFLISGVVFVLLGVFAFDSHLVFSGNVIFSVGVLLGVRSLSGLLARYLFFIGLLVSFKAPVLGIGIEAVECALWAKAALFGRARNFAKLALAAL